MILAVALVVTFMVPAMASEAAVDKKLESAIKAVKEKIDIPEDCNKFNYSISGYNNKLAWNLGWNSEDYSKSVNVTIDEDNLITNYYSYENSQSQYDKKLPKYTREQGQEIAEKFINSINPKLLSQFKLIDNSRYSIEREYYYTYIRQNSDISYSNNNINISVNNYTGKVTNFYCNFTKETSFEDASKIIGLEQAKKAFVEKLGLKMVYMLKTEKEKVVPYLAYIPKNSTSYIDALTGEVEINGYGYSYTMSDMLYGTGSVMAVKEDGGGKDTSLTPDELEVVKGMKNILTKEDADKKVRAISLLKLDSDFVLSDAYLNKDWRDNESFVWSLYYNTKDGKNDTRSVSVQIDAKSGEINSYYTYYNAPEGTKPQKTKDEAKAICDEAIKNLLPSIYSKLKYDETYNNIDLYLKYGETPNQYSFRFVRVENGIECPSNYVEVQYDNLTGNIRNINQYWTKNVEFKASEDVISIDKAYEILFSKIGYEVLYVNDIGINTSEKVVTADMVSPINAVLGYFLDSSKPSIISAATGDVLDYSGEVYKENNIPDYTDIKGLKAENQIRILTQMSIKYNESELKPNDSLLQKDYFILLCRLNDKFYFDTSTSEDKQIEQMYRMLISQGIITKEEKAPLSTLTREEAAKYFVKFLGFGKIAEIKDIYKSGFKDAKDINPQLIGYVCIASGIKAMNGSNGLFNPKAKITRLEGLLSIYSYLSNK